MSAIAANRCPRCGNDNRIDSYVCAFCGKRLRVERIENFSIFKRIEAEWTNPVPWYTIILWLFTKPNQAFWNINHKRKSAPGYKILLFNSLLYGLLGLSYISHVTIGDVPTFSFLGFLLGIGIFIAFFAFGFIYLFLLGFVLIWLFSKGANVAVDFSSRLESRFGKEEGEGLEKYQEAEMSPFSIYKGGTLHQQQANKYKMMFSAFAPFLIILPIQILISLVGLPNISIPSIFVFDPDMLRPFLASPTWTVLHLIEALTIAVWVPVLVSLSIRELSNSSTIRVLISSLVIGIIVAIVFYFLRPTF